MLTFHELHRSCKETERNVNLLKAIELDLKHGKFPDPYADMVVDIGSNINSLIIRMTDLLKVLERERANVDKS